MAKRYVPGYRDAEAYRLHSVGMCAIGTDGQSQEDWASSPMAFVLETDFEKLVYALARIENLALGTDEHLTKDDIKGKALYHMGKIARMALADAKETVQ